MNFILKIDFFEFPSLFSLGEALFAGHTQRGSGQKKQRSIKKKDDGKSLKMFLR
jgi:hypothetical protein